VQVSEDEKKLQWDSSLLPDLTFGVYFAALKGVERGDPTEITRSLAPQYARDGMVWSGTNYQG